jgi:hypothetical protein
MTMVRRTLRKTPAATLAMEVMNGQDGAMEAHKHKDSNYYS